jgi:hypothetical protein
MAKKSARKKTRKTTQGKGRASADLKKGAARLKAIEKAKKKLDLEIQKHKSHLTAMFKHSA